MFKLSIIIPTYNCASILRECLGSIREQTYPQDLVEIIIIDGFSTDNTRQVAEQFDAIVLNNPGIIHPKGRPIGIQAATGELIVCLDSDNILPETEWLQKMTTPFLDDEIVAAEPLYYMAKDTDNAITKYCSLLGGDDPIIVYLGYHERYSCLTGTWTGVPVKEIDNGEYIKVEFINSSIIPSLGANGFVVRKSALKKISFNPFHHVNISHQIIQQVGGTWAKVNTSIIHRHSDTIKQFIAKKKRRIERRMDSDVGMGYSYPIKASQIMWIVLKGIFIFPIVMDMLVGFSRRKTMTWFLHPIIFYGVLFLYSYIFLLRMVIRVKNKAYEQS